MTTVDWDDDRIAGAFRARFDRPAPASIAPSVQEAIAGIEPRRTWRVGSRSRTALAAGTAFAVVVVAGFALIGSPNVRTPGDPGSSAVGGSASATASASGPNSSSASATDALGTVLGLDIITVADALAIRDLDGDAREIAVRGWFTPAPLQHCPAVGPPSALLPGCREPWLTDEAEVLFRLANGSLSVRPPAGPAFQPLFDGLDRSWMPPPPQASESVPVEVVVLGHFDDRRARLCTADLQATCRDRFVVDRVARVDGVEQPLSHVTWSDGERVRSTLDEILAVVAKVSPGAPVLSVVTADRVSIGRLEPDLAARPTDGADPLMYVPIKWVVRVLQADRVETYVVWDDTDIIWQMTRDRGPVQVGGSSGMPEDPFAWPPLGSVIVFDLTSEVGAGRPPVQVAVVDQSGRLDSACEGASPDLELSEEQGWFNAYPVPNFPGRVHLLWYGGVCDSQITVTVAANVESMTLDTGPHEACDLMAVRREIVLDFSGVVDVPSIDLLKSVTVFD